MAITNAEMAAAWGDLLGLTPEKITELAGLLDQWALGGARLATLARLTTDVSTFNDAAIRMVHDWYGGAADGGPNGDGLYPLMNSDAEVFLLPSPAKIMAGVSGLDPKGELASTGDLPETGAQGDLWVIGGAAWVWSVSAGAWVNMGPFRGPQGDQGLQGPRGDLGGVGPKGDTGDRGIQGDVGPKGDTGDIGPKGDKGDTGDTGPKGDKGDRGEAFTVDAQGSLEGRATYDAEPSGFSYLDVENGNLYFRITPSGWSGAIPFGKGEKGDKGDPGDEGPQGPPGVDGADGSDAVVVFATVAEVRASKVEGKIISPKTMADALAPVVVTPASAATGVDFDLFLNAQIVLEGPTTIGAPANGYPGKSGLLTLNNNAAGNATVAWHSSYRMPKGGITLEPGPAAVTRVPFQFGGAGVVNLFPASKWV